LPVVILFNKWFLIPVLFFLPGFSAIQPIKSLVNQQPEALHPFYISVFEINHNSNERSLEITAKIFADDFEAVLKKNFNTILDISKEAQKPAIEKMMAEYLTKNLQLSVDGRSLEMKFLGFEKDKESVYCYLEVTALPSVKKLSVRNTVLYDHTKDQANIMHVIVGGKRKSMKLDYPKNEAVFEF
jgi:hypothetical protein